MADLNFGGFETGDDAEASSVAGTLSYSTSVTRGTWSTYSLRTNPTTTAAGKYTINTYGTSGASTALTGNTDRYLRFYFRYATKPAANNEPICVISPAAGRGTTNLEVRIGSTGVLLTYTDTTLLATGTTVLAADTWYRIEVKRLLGVTADWEVKIDGISEMSGTRNFGGTTGTTVSLGKTLNYNGQSVDYFYDDWRLSDSGYPGAGQCGVLLPSANGNYQTWSIGAGSGSHFQQVDERPPNGDTDYLLSTGTNDQAETEAVQDAATLSIAGTINNAKSIVIAKRDGASDGAIRLRLRSGATDSDTAADVASTSAYLARCRLFATDPATSLAWTTGGLDGVEVGALERSGSAILESRMTFAGLMVDWTPPAPTPQVFTTGILAVKPA